LEANGIDAQDLKEVKVTAAPERNQIQDIPAMLSVMKNATVNKVKVSEILAQRIGERTSADTASEDLQTEMLDDISGEAKVQTLTQLAANIRQFSSENVNKVIEEAVRDNNGNGSGVSVGITDISNKDTDMNTVSLTGITNIRSAEVNIANRQQIQNTVLRTNIASAANEIANMIAKNRTGGNFEIKMKLLPEALGEVLVKVTYNKGNINLNIVAENKAAETQLLSQVENLKESLASHDFNLMEFDVGTKDGFNGNQDQGGENGNNGRGFRNNFNRQTENDDTDSAQNIQRLKNLYMNRLMYRKI
jgi:flagellar hook-length control protein FliK